MARQRHTPTAMARMRRHRQALEPARSLQLRSLPLHGTRWKTC